MAVRMLIIARYLADRLSQPRTRAEEAREVRLRLVEQAGPETASPDEARIAHELRRLREGLCSLFGDTRSCRHCVPPPYGVSRFRRVRTSVSANEPRSRSPVRFDASWEPRVRGRQANAAEWEGGHCCSGPTRNLFTDEELAALRLSGTTPGLLKLPRGAHAGCAFRGPLGCSLDAAHRPCLCVRYTCRELEAELGFRCSRSAVRDLQQELRALFDRFVEARRTRRQLADLTEFLALSSDRTNE